MDYGNGERLYGDLRFETYGYGIFSDGGEDKIYGSDNLVDDQSIYGGKGNDWIWTGNNIGGDIVVSGDLKSNFFNFALPAGQTEIPDGDDIIEVGNNNLSVVVNGGGGNDKIIGGWGLGQFDRLYGNAGDDKIWLVNPEERLFEDNAD